MKKKFEDIYKITEAQRELIDAIQDFGGCPWFHGKTIDEAEKYISKYKGRYCVECEFGLNYYPD